MYRRGETRQRCAYRDADAHHKGHLHIVDIGRHARDERGGGEFVDIFKREALHAGENIVADVFGKAGARARAVKPVYAENAVSEVFGFYEHFSIRTFPHGAQTAQTTVEERFPIKGYSALSSLSVIIRHYPALSVTIRLYPALSDNQYSKKQ